MLKTQALQANQDVTFLTDGGEEVRALTERVTPAAEHGLDWFHITMRLTVLSQYAHGVTHHDEAKSADLLKSLERIKWLLWHGNLQRASTVIERFEDDVGELEVDYPHLRKLVRTAHEFAVYINHIEREQPDQLWRAIPRGRANLLLLSRVHGERGNQQTLRETSASG